MSIVFISPFLPRTDKHAWWYFVSAGYLHFGFCWSWGAGLLRLLNCFCFVSKCEEGCSESIAEKGLRLSECWACGQSCLLGRDMLLGSCLRPAGQKADRGGWG